MEKTKDNKWLSRKFITSVVTLGCLIAGNAMDFDGEQMATLLIPLIYVVVEGIKDIMVVVKIPRDYIICDCPFLVPLFRNSPTFNPISYIQIRYFRKL